MFYDDKIKNYHVMDNLQENFDTVKTEILNHINAPNMLTDYPNFKVVNNKDIYELYWKASPCSSFKDEYVEIYNSKEKTELVKYLVDQFRKNCPVTYSIIKDDEDKGVLANSFISRLIPGSIINPHHGWNRDYIRTHLGIVCDPDCKITVEGRTRTWEEGKFLAFNDGDLHGVRHDGTKERVVFSFDVNYNYLKRYIDVQPV